MIRALIFIALLFSFNAFAFSPEKRLSDPELEDKARKIFLQVRCLVCDGQVVENSDNQFSIEMRSLIREKVIAGKSANKIKDELIEEFGNDIINQPRVSNKSGRWFLLVTIFFLIFVTILTIFFFKNSLKLFSN